MPPRHRAARCWDAGPDGRVLLNRICSGVSSVLSEDGALLLVHSTLSDEQATLDRLAEAGLKWLRARPGEPLSVDFLGSGFGNATREERDGLTGDIARCLRPGESFLVSVDLDKGDEALETCYNDPPGHSAFADFVLDDFVPEAWYKPETSTVEGRLRARADRTVHVPGLGIALDLPRERFVNVGCSVKFDERGLAEEVGAHGFTPRARRVDPQAGYGLFLFHREEIRREET